MNIHTIGVPAGIRYISEWKEFRLFNFPYIIDKQITGCGFTEFAISFNGNTIAGSPRVGLLGNKLKQYLERLKKEGDNLGYKLLYAENKWEKILDIDRNMNVDGKKNPDKLAELERARQEKEKELAIEFKNNVKEFWRSCQENKLTGRKQKYCKILVTYDSFRKVKEALVEEGVFDKFNIVVDEFQSIFTDARFKATAELEFTEYLKGVQKVCYVSATPMIEKYLDQLPEFKDLPYLRLDWGMKEPSRITHPSIKVSFCDRMTAKVADIIDKYRNDSWKDTENNEVIKQLSDGSIKTIKSREAVFYFNSVKNICDIIKKSKLTKDEVNVLCANTEENERKIRKALGIRKRGETGIGTIPLRGEPRKMFTLCTRTVYLGADFYSDNARSFVFSDANVDCLAIDITLDLPQILGRQRLDENPWKNSLDIYVKPTLEINKWTSEQIEDFLNEKRRITGRLLENYEKYLSGADKENKDTQVMLYLDHIQVKAYRLDYLSVNKHLGNNPKPTFNKFVELSDIRAFEIGQVDYADRCTVYSTVNDKFNLNNSRAVAEALNKFSKTYGGFKEKMKCICISMDPLSEEEKNSILQIIPEVYSNYYRILGPARCKSLKYQRNLLQEDLKNHYLVNLDDDICNTFNEGDKLSSVDIKSKLELIYQSNGRTDKAKAKDLGKWFELKSIKVKLQDGSWANGFELIKKKY